MIKAIGFDLGDTLIEYNNVPLSWESLYEEALSDVLDKFNIMDKNNLITIGKATLSKYNTRLNPREEEVSAEAIFEEILGNWGISKDKYLDLAIVTFFSYFQRRSVVFRDVIEVLEHLKELGIKVGILTDVPYGMTKEFVMTDILELQQYIDCILTSVEVGYRKPNIKGYELLADGLKVPLEDMIYIGNEEKDIIGAKNSKITSVLLDRKKYGMQCNQDFTIETLVELLELFKLNKR